MGYRSIWLLGVTGAGHGILLYFLGRHVLRTSFDITDIADNLPFLGLALQVVILGSVSIVVLAVTFSVGRRLNIHKM